MQNKHIYSTLLLMVFSLLLVPLTHALTEETPVHRYVFDIAPNKMYGISMNFSSSLHELHVSSLEKADKDCTACHFDNDESRFMGMSINNTSVENINIRVDFIHKNCTACHVDMQSGPALTPCKTCHSGEYDPSTGLKQVDKPHYRKKMRKNYHESKKHGKMTRCFKNEKYRNRQLR